MEKISGILPANARVTTVDLKNSGVARSGTPSFGREVGASRLTERKVERDVMAQAAERHSELMQMRNRDVEADPHVQIAQRVSDSFFMKRREANDLNIQPELSSQSESTLESDVLAPLNWDVPMTTQAREPSDEEPYLGRSLDVHV